MAHARQSGNPDPLSVCLRELVGTHALLPQSEATAAHDLVAELTAAIARRARAVTQLAAVLGLPQPTASLGKQAFVDAVEKGYPQLLRVVEEARGGGSRRGLRRACGGQSQARRVEGGIFCHGH